MPLHAQHDVLKVQRGDVTGSVRILQFESFQRALLVEVVEELRELRVADGPRPVTSEVKFCERPVELERNFHVKFRLLDNRREFR